MRISEKGLNMIKDIEGLRLREYEDTGGVLTIGFGHIKNVQEGQTITLEEAEKFLREDLVAPEKVVNHNVKVPINQNQYDALVSFTLNVGVSAFRKSTLLRKINKQDVTAANEFDRWNKDNGRVISGLVARRKKEKALFLDWS